MVIGSLKYSTQPWMKPFGQFGEGALRAVRHGELVVAERLTLERRQLGVGVELADLDVDDAVDPLQECERRRDVDEEPRIERDEPLEQVPSEGPHEVGDEDLGLFVQLADEREDLVMVVRRATLV